MLLTLVYSAKKYRKNMYTCSPMSCRGSLQEIVNIRYLRYDDAMYHVDDTGRTQIFSHIQIVFHILEDISHFLGGAFLVEGLK